MSWADEYAKLRNQNDVEEVEIFYGGGTKQVKPKTSTKKKKKSFADEYTELRNQRVQEEKSVSDRVTVTDNSSKKKETSERKWFNSGLFEDGYQFGDVTKTILGTVTDVGENLLSGVMGMGEKAMDAAAYLAPMAENAQFYQNGGIYTLEQQKAHEKAVEQSKSELQKFIQKDLYDEQKVAQKIVGGVTGGFDYESTSVFGEKSDSLIQSGGQLLGTMGLQAVGVPWFLTTGATSFGSEAENALNQGASYEEAGMSASISAGAEILSEKLSGGISFGGKTLDDVATKFLARNISNKLGRTMAKLGMDMAGEGFEEVFSQVASNLGSALYKEESIEELLFSEEAFDEYVESFIGGAALGGVSSGFKAVTSKQDYVTELTDNEQKVVDKVYKDRLAEQEGKVTEKEKAKIYDQVLRDLEKGYISTDTIEEVLGGDTYKGYQKGVEYEDSILKEYDELGKKQNATLAEQARYTELSGKVKDIKELGWRKNAKSKLTTEVSSMVQNDRLAESYIERNRRGQTFNADLSQYDAKQQTVIQKAIDSGILNNTNRTHEFVDMVAKISADKGVLFDFTNNAKLKDSGFAVDGKMVNGYVTKDGVTVNIDSAKSMNSIVGHEITHVLEGTEFYDVLQNTVIEYAKAKGDYQGRYDSLSKLYENIKDANVDNELTADLVGDYLFTDSDFINRLSTEHRNVFQKIYDEIKYFCKVATAGSKEARQLEKVKREFERAYRESGEITPEAREFSDADTKYSIREEAPPKKTIEGYKVFMVKDGKLYPPMVANPEGEGTPVGVWLNADVGGLAYDADGNVQLNTKGRFKVKAGGKGTQGGGGELAFRPGWHLGEYPDASQFGRENKERLVPNKKGEMVHPKELFPYDFVWARCEVAADHDYQLDAMSFGVNKKGKFERSQAGLPYIPEDGYYKYRTNANPDTAPWIISGAIKVVEILDDDQVARICAEHGVTPQQRQGYEVGAKSVKGTAKPGNKIDLSMFGLKAGQVTPTAAEVLEQIRLTEGTAAERKAKAMEILKTLPGYAKRQIDFDDANIIKEFGMNNQNVDDYRRMAEESGHGYLADDKIYSDKPKYSISDSDGKKLTKEQQEYFKDSKMRDEDGNLKVMYHGSQDAGFHVFDANMSDDGTSFFFVDRNDVAATYSGTTETYEARTIRTAADMNNFLAEIGYDSYEAIEKDGKFELLENGDHVAWSDTAQGIYEEFCWYESVGEGDANYKVYLNLKNPMVVDAQGRNWNNVSREYSQEVADRYHSLTAEEKFALTDIAGWGEISIFRDEIKNATDGALASAYQKMGDVNMYDLFTIAEDNFSEETIKQFAVKQMNTRDYAQKAKSEGYDGVIFKNIHDNGGYSNGSEGASTVAIAFDSNQIKSAANEKPTKDADIRYSLSSIANTFFGDENMTSSEFKKMDYRETQGYKDYVDQCLNNYKQTRKDFDSNVAKQEIEESIKGIVDVAIAAKTAGYDIQDTAMRRNAKDSKKRLLFSSLEPNSEYLTSHDISTICDKRKNFADIYDEIVKAEERKGVPQNKRFFSNVDNYFYLHKLMADKGLTQPCRQCYVESMRKNLAPMANAFLRLVGETNPNNTLNDQLYHQKGKQKGELKTNNAATREWVLEKLAEYDMSVSDLTVEKLTTEDGLAQLKLQAPLIYEAFNSFYGQSKPKMPKSATPFRFGELTALLTDEKGNIKKSLIDKINSTGGFRLQSYSDFQIQNYTDVLQVLFEAGTLGLNGHAYTKVPAFLDATAGTNLKRNISIFMYKDGDKWRLDRNDSFPYTLEQIYDIVKADKSGNTGIIAVSQNADMSAWIMANDLVGYGIPFHKSGLKMGTVRDTIVREDGREIKGYTGTKDHTKQQTEVWAKTADDHKALTKVKKGINIYSFWDFDNKANLSKNDLIEKNVKAYIDACEMAGYLPKFREYVMNNGKVLNDVLKYSKELGYASQDATIDDISFEYKGYRIPYGYYKFLGDFGMFTPDGVASPQATLSLKDYDFDKAVKFFSDAETLRRNEILQQFSNGAERQKYRDSNLSAEELQEIVKRKRKDIAQSVVDLAPAMSLSEEGETPKQFGSYNVSGKDIALEVAPVGDNATDNATNATPVLPNATVSEMESVEELFPDDLAPIESELERLIDEEADIRGAMEAYAAVGDVESVNKLIPEHEALKERISELQQSEAERAGSLTDADAPPEEDARFPGDTNEEYVENPFEDRDWYDMKNRSVKAYMYENPEVKPFFQEEAMNLLGEMNDGNQAERWYNDELHYASGGEKGFGGIKRHMPKDIEEMLDSWHMSYDDIRKGLNAIIEDNGAENIAAAKKIEFMLNRRLLQGYESFYTKKRVPPNDAYLDLLYEKQINEYSEEAFAKFMENADQYAPVAATSEEDIAPAVASKPETTTKDIFDSLKNLRRNRKMEAGGYTVGMYTKNGSEDIRIYITKPSGETIKETITGGKYWTNTQLQNEIAKTITEAAVDTKAPVAPVAVATEPVKERYEAIKPKPVKEPRMARATPAEQARAEILTEEPEVDKKKPGAWEWFKNSVLDKGMVFEDLSLATGNRELQARWNSIRYAEGKAQKLIGEGNSSVRALTDLEKEVKASGKLKSFYEYLYHVHNIDRMTLEERFHDVPNKAVFGDSVTADVSRAEVKKLERMNPEFKSWAKDVYDYNKFLREMAVDGGLISKEIADLWQTMYPHYVPVRRAGDTGVNVNVPLDTGRTGVNAPFKKATGGSRDILPLFDTMAQRTLQTYRAISKNRFGVELKNTLRTTISQEASNVDEAIDSVEAQDLLQKGENGKKPTFTVFENGKKVTFEITDEMYNSMKPTSDMMHYTNKVANAVSNFRRGTLTEYNPWFMLKNAVKDVQDVLINSQHPARTYAAVPKAIKHMASKGHYYQEYMENGGDQNSYFDGQTNTFKEENPALERAKAIFGLNAISKANNIIERLPRLAEYIASREAGESVDVAMLDAARVTTNFAAGGDVTKFFNRNGFTFLNASVQGAVQQARNIREAKMNGLKGWASLAGKYIAAGIPAVMLNHLIWDDDEEYAELSDYVKQNYYIVGKFGDGKFVRIPKGRTVAVIQNAFEQMENLITGNDEADLKTFLELAVSNLAPNNPLDNNILSPIIQVMNNETWYGDDLVPTRLQDLPAGEQYDETTDSISKWLGETFNVSPYKANYLLDQYSGLIGDTFLPMLTPEAESGDSDILAPLRDMFTTDSVLKNQNVSNFYDLKDELTVTANGMNATDEDKLRAKYINSISAELSELYQQKREIQNSDMSDADKYSEVRDIQQQIVDLMKEGMDNYQGVSYEDDYRAGGEYARVADRVYKLTEDGEWQKLSDEQLTKYEVTKAAGDASYASDGTNHYRWYVKEGEKQGEWMKITDKQLEKQREVTSALNVSPSEYWENKEEYDFAYESPESYAVAKAVGGYEAYRQYSSELYDIKADKDKWGKSISGSRKEKVQAYIDSLDADYWEKVILFKSEYTSYDDENYGIIEYLNGRDDISFDEMKAILLKLGFEVDSEGNIRW